MSDIHERKRIYELWTSVADQRILLMMVLPALEFLGWAFKIFHTFVLNLHAQTLSEAYTNHRQMYGKFKIPLRKF